MSFSSAIAVDAKALEIVEHVCSCETLERMFNDVLTEIGQYLDAETACAFELFHLDGRPWIGKATSMNMPVSVLTRYNTRYVAMDPICGMMFSTLGVHQIGPSTAKVFRLSDRVNPDNEIHAEYCHDFLHEERLDHVLGIVTRSSVDQFPLFTLGFHRPASSADFNRDVVARARAILPAVLSRVEYFAVRYAYDLLQRQVKGASVAKVAYEVELAADFRIRVIRHEGGMTRAREIVSDNGALIYFPGLGTVLEGLAGRRHPASKVAEVIAALGIDDIAVSSDVMIEKLENGEAQSRFLLTLSAPVSSDPTERWADLHGLTKAEFFVLKELVKGHKNKLISDHLNLSVRTVENHLRSIFSKAGASSRAQVLSDILSLQAH